MFLFKIINKNKKNNINKTNLLINIHLLRKNPYQTKSKLTYEMLERKRKINIKRKMIRKIYKVKKKKASIPITFS